MTGDHNSLPTFLDRPPVPPAPRKRETYPRVLWQEPTGDGDVLVTFALPGLRRHTVRVSQTAWLNGDHLPIGANAHRMLDGLLPPAAPDTDDVSDVAGDLAG